MNETNNDCGKNVEKNKSTKIMLLLSEVYIKIWKWNWKKNIIEEK